MFTSTLNNVWFDILEISKVLQCWHKPSNNLSSPAAKRNSASISLKYFPPSQTIHMPVSHNQMPRWELLTPGAKRNQHLEQGSSLSSFHFNAKKNCTSTGPRLLTTHLQAETEEDGRVRGGEHRREPFPGRKQKWANTFKSSVAGRWGTTHTQTSPWHWSNAATSS